MHWQVWGMEIISFFVMQVFPIPKEVERVDLALTFGIPNMDQCLKAILDEIVVQKVTIAKEMKDLNDEGYQFLKKVFKNQNFQKFHRQNL